MVTCLTLREMVCVTWRQNMSHLWLSWQVRSRNWEYCDDRKGKQRGHQTRYLEGYVEKDGLDFIVWISLGKCVSLVLLYTEQFVLFLCSLQYPNIEYLYIHTHQKLLQRNYFFCQLSIVALYLLFLILAKYFRNFICCIQVSCYYFP